MKQTTIIGGGLVGSILACFLSKNGHSVQVFERRNDPRRNDAERGRSINLALSDRGWRALEKIGLADKVRPIAIPMKGRMIHQLDGATNFIPYGEGNQAIYSVSRGDLNKIMIAEADEFKNTDFFFSQKCESIDFEKNTITFKHTQSGEIATHNVGLTFGADGAFSELRFAMQRTPNFNFSQTYEPYSYKELHIPDLDGQWQLEKNALHIWPRESFMMIALPNTDGSFTCTLFASYDGENGFDAIKTDADIENYFKTHFASAYDLMPDLVRDFRKNPTSSLVTMRCYPWVHKNFALIGDAAHAIVPFYGQGMNCGFEDVNVLFELLAENSNQEEWLDAYQKSRKPNADAIANLALYNYIEMRDLAGRPEFQLRTKIEKRIAAHFPERFQTLYSMVTFSRLPYATALSKSKEQSELLDKIMHLHDIENKWDADLVLKMADDWLIEKGL
jgi:kynurenine 3-monooxygenase